MKIVVAGAGAVGSHLAKMLSEENHDIILIDPDEDKLRLEYDLETSVSAVASCLGNIGPGLGKAGPLESYSHFSDFGKWFLSFLMLIGRLELFTVLILFTPAFRKR